MARETASRLSLKLLQRGGGKVRMCGILVKRGHVVIRHSFWQKIAASHEEQMSPLMIVVL